MRVMVGRAIGRGLRDATLGWACGSVGEYLFGTCVTESKFCHCNGGRQANNNIQAFFFLNRII